MNSLDAVLDDYLHRVSRVTPWARHYEGWLLEAFRDWLESRWGAPPALADLAPRLVIQYADETNLSSIDCQELLDSLDRLRRCAGVET